MDCAGRGGGGSEAATDKRGSGDQGSDDDAHAGHKDLTNPNLGYMSTCELSNRITRTYTTKWVMAESSYHLIVRHRYVLLQVIE